VLVLDACVLLNGDHRVVARRQLSGCGHGDLTGIVLESLQQLSEILIGLIGVHRHDRDVGHREVQDPVIQGCVDQSTHLVGAQVRSRSGCPRVAVMGCVQGVLGSHGTGSAGLVHDHDLLAQAVL
jgi:hypothetical protein